MNDLDKARKWAGRIIAQEPDTQATCRVIQSLPNQWVDAEKLRYAIESLREGGNPGSDNIADALESLLPVPPLPTLADMDEDARHALIGKDVKVEGWNNPSMLIAVHKDEGAVLGHNWINPWPFVEVRPLSELSPANGDVPTVAEHANVAPDQAVTKDVCNCRDCNSEESSLPRPEDVPAGEPWIVLCGGKRWVGVHADTPDRPWSITRMDGLDYQNVADSEIALISRLMPEVKP